MTGKQLKNSILQLAIQGKLVPQDPHDEPASELLKRIRKEKEQLVKTGKLKKKDLESTPIAEDEKPFEIPESWEWVRLGDLASFVVDCPHSTPNKVNYATNYPCIRTSEIKEGKIVWSSMQYLDEANYNIRIARLKPQEGDIVYAREGAYGDAVILPDTHQFCLGQRTMMLRMALRDTVEYIHKAIISPFVFSQAVMLNREGTTSVGHVNMSDIVKFVIPLPPLSEQHRIVEKIEELMLLVEEYDKAQSELDKLNESLPEQLKKSILQQAIMGKLVPQDPNDEPASELLKRIHKEKENLVKSGALKKKDLITTPISDDEKSFEIPESWEWVRIGEIADITNGFTPLRTNPQFWNDADIPWFTVDDIRNQGRKIRYTNQKISQNALAKDSTRIVPEGSLLLCCTASVGEYALALIPLTTNQQFNAISIKSNYKKLVSSDYLFAIAPTFKNRLLSMAGKTTFNFVSVKKVSELIIPLPPLSEQHRIVAKIEELFSILK